MRSKQSTALSARIALNFAAVGAALWTGISFSHAENVSPWSGPAWYLSVDEVFLFRGPFATQDECLADKQAYEMTRDNNSYQCVYYANKPAWDPD